MLKSDDEEVSLKGNLSADDQSKRTVTIEANQKSQDSKNHPKYDPFPRFVSGCYICWYTLMFAVSLFGLVYAQLSDTNEVEGCGDSNLATGHRWLLLGCIPLLITSLIFLSGYCFLRCCSSLALFDRVQRILWSSITTTVHCILSLFFTIWSIQGFLVYTDFPAECQSSDIGVIILLLSIFHLLNVCSICCCVPIVNCFNIMQCLDCCMYYSKRDDEFRLTREQIIKACPECVDEEYLKSHPYIKVIDLDKMPSIKFREFDFVGMDGKNKKVEKLMSGENIPPVKDLLKEARFGSYIFSAGFVKQPPLKHNTIIDNIYLNDDIRFAVIAHKSASIDKGIILYTHGGGYIAGSHRDNLPMLSFLSELTGCIAISIDYKLCPEHPLPQCVNDALVVYKWLCDVDGVRSQWHYTVSSHCPDWLLSVDGKGVSRRCVFGGDSAGGGLCLLLLQAVNKDNSLNLPCCAWAISPWTQLVGIDKRDNAKIDAVVYDPYLHLNSNNDQSMITLAHMLVGNFDVESDKMVRNKGDASYCDVEDAKYSPFNGDVKGLCPIYMSVGASEMLLDGTLSFAEKAYNEGVEVEVEIEPYLCHVYPTFVSIFPEAKEAVTRASEFINRQLQKQG